VLNAAAFTRQCSTPGKRDGGAAGGEEVTAGRGGGGGGGGRPTTIVGETTREEGWGGPSAEAVKSAATAATDEREEGPLLPRILGVILLVALPVAPSLSFLFARDLETIFIRNVRVFSPLARPPPLSPARLRPSREPDRSAQLKWQMCRQIVVRAWACPSHSSRFRFAIRCFFRRFLRRSYVSRCLDGGGGIRSERGFWKILRAATKVPLLPEINP